MIRIVYCLAMYIVDVGSTRLSSCNTPMIDDIYIASNIAYLGRYTLLGVLSSRSKAS